MQALPDNHEKHHHLVCGMVQAQEQVKAAQAQLVLQQERMAEAVLQVEGKAEYLNKVRLSRIANLERLAQICISPFGASQTTGTVTGSILPSERPQRLLVWTFFCRLVKAACNGTGGLQSADNDLRMTLLYIADSATLPCS